METYMPLWFWLNIPACALFFLATTGIPLWMVLRHPDQGPDRPADAPRPPAPEDAHRTRELDHVH
jgi:hypothetical protein